MNQSWLRTFNLLKQRIGVDMDGLALLANEPQALSNYDEWLKQPGIDDDQRAFITHIQCRSSVWID